MTRAHAPVGLIATLLFAGPAAAQQGAMAAPPGVRVTGPGGPGLQPQVTTGPYQQFLGGGYGANPFAGPAVYPVLPQVPWYVPRPAPRPFVFVPPPAPRVAPNNPVLFNPGPLVPFPLAIPPGGPAAAANGVAFNPLFVARPGVPSAYYSPPVPPLSGSSRTEELPVPSWAGAVLTPVTGSAPAAPPDPPRSFWRWGW